MPCCDHDDGGRDEVSFFSFYIPTSLTSNPVNMFSSRRLFHLPGACQPFRFSKVTAAKRVIKCFSRTEKSIISK